MFPEGFALESVFPRGVRAWSHPISASEGEAAVGSLAPQTLTPIRSKSKHVAVFVRPRNRDLSESLSHPDRFFPPGEAGSS